MASTLPNFNCGASVRVPRLGDMTIGEYLHEIGRSTSRLARQMLGPLPRCLLQGDEVPRPGEFAHLSWGAQCEEVNRWYDLFTEAMADFKAFYEAHRAYFGPERERAYFEAMMSLNKANNNEDFFAAAEQALILHVTLVQVAEGLKKNNKRRR